MNEKEVLVRILDCSKNNYMIRAEYTSIPSEMLKMYHYMKDKDGLYIRLKDDNEEINSGYNDVIAMVRDVEVIPGGDALINCIDVYVEVIGI